MLNTATEMLAMKRAAELETPLAAVEARLASLGVALRDNDAAAIETEAAGLHRALASAIAHFGRAAHEEGGVPPPLRRRLAVAGGQVAAQRQALARATAALDRAIDVLLPGMEGHVYASSGAAERSGSTQGSLLA